MEVVSKVDKKTHRKILDYLIKKNSPIRSFKKDEDSKPYTCVFKDINLYESGEVRLKREVLDFDEEILRMLGRFRISGELVILRCRDAEVLSKVIVMLIKNLYLNKLFKIFSGKGCRTRTSLNHIFSIRVSGELNLQEYRKFKALISKIITDATSFAVAEMI